MNSRIHYILFYLCFSFLEVLCEIQGRAVLLLDLSPSRLPSTECRMNAGMMDCCLCTC